MIGLLARRITTYTQYPHHLSLIGVSSKMSSLSLTNNPNKDLCNMLKELAEYEKAVNKNIYKSRAYQQAAATISRLNYKVSSGEDAKKLKGIGDKIGKKIDEYLATGTLKKLDNIHKDASNEAIILLSRVHGIGSAKARELVTDFGINTLEQLRKRQDELNLYHHQLIGIKYFEDFEKPIPRKEIAEVEKIVKEHVAKYNPELQVTFCGSYRREKPESGDMDILITMSSYVSTCDKKEGSTILRNFVHELERIKLITDTISIGDVKFMGVTNIGKVKGHESTDALHRHLDIRVCPSDQYYCHMLHFTGSSLFNQNMRQHALSQGYTLNEYSLRPVGTAGTAGSPVIINVERDIFEYIDYPYREPKDRNN